MGLACEHANQIILPSKFACGIIFEMAVITINALSGYNKSLMILLFFICSLKGYGD